MVVLEADGPEGGPPEPESGPPGLRFDQGVLLPESLVPPDGLSFLCSLGSSDELPDHCSPDKPLILPLSP